MRKSGNKRCSIWWTQHLIVCTDLTERFIRTQITWLSNIFTSPVFRYQFTRITQLPWIIFFGGKKGSNYTLHTHNGFFNSITDWFSIQSMAPILVSTQNTNSNSNSMQSQRTNLKWTSMCCESSETMWSWHKNQTNNFIALCK